MKTESKSSVVERDMVQAQLPVFVFLGALFFADLVRHIGGDVRLNFPYQQSIDSMGIDISYFSGDIAGKVHLD